MEEIADELLVHLGHGAWHLAVTLGGLAVQLHNDSGHGWSVHHVPNGRAGREVLLELYKVFLGAEDVLGVLFNVLVAESEDLDAAVEAKLVSGEEAGGGCGAAGEDDGGLGEEGALEELEDDRVFLKWLRQVIESVQNQEGVGASIAGEFLHDSLLEGGVIVVEEICEAASILYSLVLETNEYD